LLNKIINDVLIDQTLFPFLKEIKNEVIWNVAIDENKECVILCLCKIMYNYVIFLRNLHTRVSEKLINILNLATKSVCFISTNI
jgi:hypothetical protein